MNLMGLLVGLGSFVIIGAYHPIVTKTEYHFGKRVWPLFLVLGILFCAAAVLVKSPYGSALLAVLAFTNFWSIREMHEQEERVQKGWFPANPKRNPESSVNMTDGESTE